MLCNTLMSRLIWETNSAQIPKFTEEILPQTGNCSVRLDIVLSSFPKLLEDVSYILK